MEGWLPPPPACRPGLVPPLPPQIWPWRRSQSEGNVLWKMIRLDMGRDTSLSTVLPAGTNPSPSITLANINPPRSFLARPYCKTASPFPSYQLRWPSAVKEMKSFSTAEVSVEETKLSSAILKMSTAEAAFSQHLHHFPFKSEKRLPPTLLWLKKKSPWSPESQAWKEHSIKWRLLNKVGAYCVTVLLWFFTIRTKGYSFIA